MTTEVQDNRERSRFEVLLDGALAGFASYRIHAGSIEFTHAEVFDEHEGEGLGSRLAAESLDTARDAGLAVVPACPFYADYVQRHPEYAELVPAGRRTEFGL